jgi:hypothetical protein
VLAQIWLDALESEKLELVAEDLGEHGKPFAVNNAMLDSSP